MVGGKSRHREVSGEETVMHNRVKEGGYLFREEQRFRQWWIHAVVLWTAGFAWYDLFRELLSHRSPGDRPSLDRLMVLIRLLMGIGFPWLFLSSRLVVEVREDGMYYRFHPFHRRRHRLGREHIVGMEAKTYRPILDYGGWGIRWGWRGGKAYNVSGNRGVELRLRDGRRVLFGSRRPEELEAALRALL